MRPFSHFQPILQLDLRWPLTLVHDLWLHEHSHIISINQVWFKSDFNFSNEAIFTFSAYLTTWPQMTFDFDTWPLISLTYEGSHIISINQVWFQSDFNVSNKAIFTFSAYHTTCPQMTFDFDTWPLTSLTYEGSHIISINQVWFHSDFNVSNKAIFTFSAILQLDLRWPLTLVHDLWLHEHSHIRPISINQVWFKSDLNFSNETIFTFSAYLTTWTQMTFDFDTWPLTSLTYEGSHIISINQVWFHSDFNVSNKAIFTFSAILQLDLRWPLTLVHDLWLHEHSHIRPISINQVWFKSELNFSNETIFTFSTYLTTWPQMTFDLGTWPLTAWTFTYYINKPSLVQIGLQLFKWGHFHIFSLSYNLTWDDLWLWYMTSDLINIWKFPMLYQ